MKDVCHRFDDMLWHDSKLLELKIYRTNSKEQVRVRVGLRQLSAGPRLVDIVFLDSTYFESKIDLEGKRVCSDDIAAAGSYGASSWLQELARSSPYDSFAGYIHFRIDLIPPGGSINILAKDFVVQDVTPSSV